MQPRELEALWPQREPLRPEAAELGARAWAAAAAPDPTALAALLATDTSALPLLAPALRRWLEELPDAATGLALSERQILELLAGGPRTRHELFLAHMERETVLFHGDAWFFDRIAGLGPLVPAAIGWRSPASAGACWPASSIARRSRAWIAGSAARTWAAGTGPHDRHSLAPP